MRYINKVGVWPVGIAGGLRFEGPVCKDGKVIAWHAAWGNERKFQIDFAGSNFVYVHIIIINF